MQVEPNVNIDFFQVLTVVLQTMVGVQESVFQQEVVEQNVYEYTSLLSNDSVYARIGTVDSGENRIGKSFKMAALYQKRVDTFPKLG